jgi:hypothetical protein
MDHLGNGQECACSDYRARRNMRVYPRWPEKELSDVDDRAVVSIHADKDSSFPGIDAEFDRAPRRQIALFLAYAQAG